jgi:hypothetical protein
MPKKKKLITSVGKAEIRDEKTFAVQAFGKRKRDMDDNDAIKKRRLQWFFYNEKLGDNMLYYGSVVKALRDNYTIQYDDEGVERNVRADKVMRMIDFSKDPPADRCEYLKCPNRDSWDKKKAFVCSGIR